MIIFLHEIICNAFLADEYIFLSIKFIAFFPVKEALRILTG